jgi:hypothetical protein
MPQDLLCDASHDCDCDRCCAARWTRDRDDVLAAMVDAARRDEAVRSAGCKPGRGTALGRAGRPILRLRFS